MRARQMSDVSDKSRSTVNKHPPQSGTANRTPHIAKVITIYRFNDPANSSNSQIDVKLTKPTTLN